MVLSKNKGQKMDNLKVGDMVAIKMYFFRNHKKVEEVVAITAITKITKTRIYCGKWERRSGYTNPIVGNWAFNKKDWTPYGETYDGGRNYSVHPHVE